MGEGGVEVGGEREIVYLSLHCHHQNDSQVSVSLESATCTRSENVTQQLFAFCHVTGGPL